MLTPENAGCPKCFAPLEFQGALISMAASVVILNGHAYPAGGLTFSRDQIVGFSFSCAVCDAEYTEMRERNAHDMADYVAAQEKKKDKAVRKAQSKKKKKP